MNNIKQLIKSWFFKEKSMWIDLGLFDDSGRYYLIQMRFCIKSNKKEFRKTCLGFVNDHTQKQEIYQNCLKYKYFAYLVHTQIIPLNQQLID